MNRPEHCPECDKQTQTTLALLWVGPGWQLSLDIEHCQSCGWVTVTDWYWSKKPQEATR